MKVIKRVLIIIVVIAIVVISSQIIKNRGGVNVKCQVDYPLTEGLSYYRQDDDDWKSLNLGNSEYTMESSGCITTCIATAISGNEDSLNPGQLVTLLSENNVFDENGNMQWGQLDEIPNFNTKVYSSPDVSYINECLSEGHYPIVKVHRKSLFSYHHFVLIIGTDGEEYICMDPLEDNLTKLSDYGNRIYSVRCVWYENE